MAKNLLRKFRKGKGLSQLQLAMRTGIAPNIISNIENERIFAYKGWRRRLSDALEVSEERIFPKPGDDSKGGNL